MEENNSTATIPVTDISLDQTTLTFNATNQTVTLTATVTPSDATNKEVTWTSSNTAVATVSSTGVVTSKGNGTAVITATTTDGTNLTATCHVTVTIDNDSIIEFADANVKAICVAFWDANSDGELSKDEAAAVTNLGERFKGNYFITSYNELKYFTGLSSIGREAFEDCSGLTSVTIPNSVTSIGYNAFYNCSSLTSVTIPNSVTSIGDWAFPNCSSLTSVTIPNSVTSIGNGAFSNCSGLTSVHITDLAAWCGIAFGSSNANPLYYAHHLFVNGEEITDMVIPDGVTSIGSDAFNGCSGLTSITIGNSVTSIGKYAFSGCGGLTSVHITDLAAWCGIAFGSYSNPLYYARHLYVNGEEITDLVIPDGVTSIGGGAFCGCSSLSSVTIGNSVTSIGTVAFMYCSGLTSVTIGNSVTSIGDDAFYYCYSLTSVHITDLAAWYGIAFGNYSANPLYYAHHLFVNGEEITDLVIPDSLTNIGNYAFYGCSGLTSITIPNSVTSIGNGAFSNCRGLTSISIPNSVTSIGKYAFSGCSSLTSVIIPNSVTSIGSSAFSDCPSLTSIIVEEENTVYDSRDNCNAIVETETNTLICGCQNTIIPESVTSISNSAFYGCWHLTSVTIPGSVTSIGSWTFGYCSGLTSVTIPNSVTSIGEWAFDGCSGLTSVTIPNSVTTIDYYAFYDCSGLTDVYCLAEEVPETKSNAFFESPIESATLYVPAASLEAYKSTEPWSGFGTIVGLSQDVIDGIGLTPAVSKEEEDWFTLDGKKLIKPQRGINIIRYSDGTTRKVLKR